MSTWLNFLWPASSPPSVSLHAGLTQALDSFDPGIHRLLERIFPTMHLTKEVSTEKPSKTLCVTVENKAKTLRIIDLRKIENPGDLLDLDSRQRGLEWDAFNSDKTLEGAIVYSPHNNRIHYLSSEEVLEYLKNPPYFRFILLGTLSSTEEPTYHLPIFSSPSMSEFFKSYPPSRLRNAILMHFAFHYRELSIDRHLGTGSFNTVWAITYRDKRDQPIQKVLRIPKRLIPLRNSKELQTRLMTQRVFGGEFAQYIPNDPCIAQFDEALVLNEEQKLETLNRDQIHGYFKDHATIGRRSFTLLASVGEYLPGAVPLSDYLVGKTLSEEHVVSSARQLLLALADLYQCRIIHRDLKTGNILVIEKGSDLILKVFDFGFAYVHTEQEDLSESTLMHHLAKTRLGTPMTMTPELIKGEKYGFSADLYGAGCILYELIFGKAFRGECKTIQDVAKHSIEDHTEELERQMDASEIKERFPTHHEALKALLIGLLSQKSTERPAPFNALDKLITDPPPLPEKSWNFHHLLFLGGAIFITYLICKRLFREMQTPLEDAPIIYRFQK